MSFLLRCFTRRGNQITPSQNSICSAEYHLKPSNVEAAATENLLKIFDELRCPLCLNVCMPPIYNCINGHIICNICRQQNQLSLCPTCSQSLSHNARNKLAENFVLSYGQQCRYAQQGCEYIRLSGFRMKPHEDKCMFRPIKCIVPTCQLEIPYKHLLTHMIYTHRISGTDQLPACVQFNYKPNRSSKSKKRPRWLPFYIQAYNNTYYVVMQRIGKIYWIWVYSQLNREIDEQDYSYNAYIKLRHWKNKTCVSWHGLVHSIRTPAKFIRSKGNSFSLPSHLLKKFAIRGVLSFAVDIRKKAKIGLPLTKGKLNGEGDSEMEICSRKAFPTVSFMDTTVSLKKIFKVGEDENNILFEEEDDEETVSIIDFLGNKTNERL